MVNISSSGVFLEGLTRLLPNTHTDIHIVTRRGRVLVRGRVVRALVWRLERDMVCYRMALSFESAVDVETGPALSDRSESNGYPVPAEIPGTIEAPGSLYPNAEVQDRV